MVFYPEFNIVFRVIPVIFEAKNNIVNEEQNQFIFLRGYMRNTITTRDLYNATLAPTPYSRELYKSVHSYVTLLLSMFN